MSTNTNLVVANSTKIALDCNEYNRDSDFETIKDLICEDLIWTNEEDSEKIKRNISIIIESYNEVFRSSKGRPTLDMVVLEVDMFNWNILYAVAEADFYINYYPYRSDNEWRDSDEIAEEICSLQDEWFNIWQQNREYDLCVNYDDYISSILDEGHMYYELCCGSIFYCFSRDLVSKIKISVNDCQNILFKDIFNDQMKFLIDACYANEDDFSLKVENEEA